jgi:hypothetical protein
LVFKHITTDGGSWSFLLIPASNTTKHTLRHLRAQTPLIDAHTHINSESWSFLFELLASNTTEHTLPDFRVQGAPLLDAHTCITITNSGQLDFFAFPRVLLLAFGFRCRGRFRPFTLRLGNWWTALL